LRTSFRMSRQLGRHGVMIERLVGVATHSHTAEGMVQWANDPRVTAEMLRGAMRELTAEQARVTPLSACLKVEYLATTSWVKAHSSEALLHSNVLRTSPSLGRIYLFLNGEPELFEHTFAPILANWLTQADKPKPQRTNHETFLSLFEPDPTIPKRQRTPLELRGYFAESILARLFIRALPLAFKAADREAACDAALSTALALERFSREHGHYPEQLEELVPDFLPAVLEDNFASPKTPLRYRRDADGALIYSVGDNGTDDGELFEKVKDIGYGIGKLPAKAPE
jgi:hypothetical protein